VYLKLFEVSLTGIRRFNANADILAIGRDSCQELFPGGFEVPVESDFSGLIDDTDVHGLFMQVNAAVILVLFGVE